MKTFDQFISEAWVPPMKKLKSGQTPLAKARTKAKTNPKITPEKIETVRTSPRRETGDTSEHPDFSTKHEQGGSIVLTHKHHPTKLTLTPSGKNQYTVVTDVTGKAENRPAAFRSMVQLKKEGITRAVPKTGGMPTIHSQPVGPKRGAINQKLGFSDVSSTGNQYGKPRRLSPRQKQNRAQSFLPGDAK